MAVGSLRDVCAGNLSNIDQSWVSIWNTLSSLGVESAVWGLQVKIVIRSESYARRRVNRVSSRAHA